MDNIISSLEQIYAEYRKDLEEAKAKQKFTDGLFGFGHPLKDNPCHERFDVKMEQALTAFTDEKPSSEEAEQAFRYVAEARDGYRYDESAKLMLCAAERHLLLLIPFLDTETASRLRKAYAARYSRWERLPVQKNVLKALTEKEKGKNGP